MVQRELLLFKYILIIAALGLLLSCGNSKNEVDEISTSFFVNTSMIPKDTILSNSPNLILDNGIYYLDKKLFSGYIKDLDQNQELRVLASYLKGMQHGITLTFYPNGTLRDSRIYKENRSFGKHYGYWENGNQKFEFYYLNDKREGSNKQWYESGQAYAFLNFKDDKEDGMQQAWRQNGKPYINYQAKDGLRYGLQKASLCYTLIDEKLKKTK